MPPEFMSIGRRRAQRPARKSAWSVSTAATVFASARTHGTAVRCTVDSRC